MSADVTDAAADTGRRLHRLRKPVLATLFVASTLSAVAVTAVAYAATPLGGVGFERCTVTYLEPGASAAPRTVSLPDVASVGDIQDKRPITLPVAVATSSLRAGCQAVNNTTGQVTFALVVDAVDTEGTVCLNDSDASHRNLGPGRTDDVTFSAPDAGCGSSAELRVQRVAQVPSRA